MKKIFARNVLIGFIVFAATGCLKDTGYDEQKYGINITEVKGVAFAEASSSPIEVSLNSQTASATINGPLITLEQDGYPSSTVNVGIQTNNNLVTAAGYTVLPTNAYSLNFTTVPVVAGKKVTDTLRITFPNTSVLDATQTYAIGFSIVSVDQGYKIAANQRNVIFAFTIKNKYDGVYSLNLRLDNWQAYGIASGIAGAYNANFELLTAGTNAVTINALAPSGFANLQPGFTGGVGSITGFTGFGAAAPKYFFGANDKVTAVTNTEPDDGRGRSFYLDPASTTSQWTASPRGIKVEYFMKQNGRPDQKITANYTYLRAR